MSKKKYVPYAVRESRRLKAERRYRIKTKVINALCSIVLVAVAEAIFVFLALL